MSTEETRVTMLAYLDALVMRGAFPDYFADDVTFTIMGTNQTVHGQAAVEEMIYYLQEQAFDAHPVIKNMIFAAGQAAVEFEFLGTHIGEFNGIAATGRPVKVPYVAMHDLAGGKITHIRMYLPMDVLMQQIIPTPAFAGTVA